ncbi:MAG: hypothetical protein ACK4NF_04275 [Planctomycetota bacterium]
MRRGYYYITTYLYLFTSIVIFGEFDDFCNNIYENFIINSQKPQDKYLREKLDNIAKGGEAKKGEAVKKLVNLVKKRRTGKCSLNFLESLSTYINDYLATIENEEGSKVAIAKIRESIADKIECLLVRSELNLRVKVKLPKIVCELPSCYATLSRIEAAFAGSKNLLLVTFLEQFWGSYYTEKQEIQMLWEKDICGVINENIETMKNNEGISEQQPLIEKEEFKSFVYQYLIQFFGNKLLPKCGNPCVDKVINTVSKKTLDCEDRALLLELTTTSLTKTTKSLPPEIEEKLFETFGTLVKDECYAIQKALPDIFFGLELFSNEKIFDIVVAKILKRIKSNSFDARYLKQTIVSGFINVSHKIYNIKKFNELLSFLEEEFEKVEDYEYKEILLRALFAFNDYKYLLKNRNKLFNEFNSRCKNLNVKGIPSLYADKFNYTTRLLQIGTIYGINLFKEFVDKNAKNSVQELINGQLLEKDKHYLLLLFSLFGNTEKNFVDNYLIESLKGVTMVSPFLVKQYALKTLFYNTSKKELISSYTNKLFEYPDVGCLSYLINALLGDITTLKKVENLENCERIRLNTKSVQELIKIAIDPQAWKNKIKEAPEAVNITNLELSKATEFVTYDSCGVGHEAIGGSPNLLANMFYGLECRELFKGTCSFCDYMSFVSAIVYLMLNALENPTFYKKLDGKTLSTYYKGPLKFVLRKIARELNATISFKALQKSPHKYLLNIYSGFLIPTNPQTQESLYTYKTLLTKISERFLLTFLFTKKKGANIMKVVPFESAASIWALKLRKYFKD